MWLPIKTIVDYQVLSHKLFISLAHNRIKQFLEHSQTHVLSGIASYKGLFINYGMAPQQVWRGQNILTPLGLKIYTCFTQTLGISLKTNAITVHYFPHVYKYF